MDAGAGRQLDGRQGAGKEGVSAQQGREGHLVKGLDSTWFQFMGLPCSTCADVLWWAVGWWWAGGVLDRAQALGLIPHHQLGTCKRLPKGTPAKTAENRELGGLGAMVDSLLWFSH